MRSTSAAASVVIWLTCLLVAPAWVQAAPEGRREMLRIRIANDAEGPIAVSRDRGSTWAGVGRVLRYTARVNRRGYTASKWAPAGQVAATAVNAIHINAGYNREDDRGVVFSLLPREMLAAPAGYGSFLSPDSSIYTDIPAGESIFGGGDAPFVGSQVYLEGEDDVLSPVEEGYVPARGDVLVIVVLRRTHHPLEARFENREGGGVWLLYNDGSWELIGRVIRPVRGIGRFLGARYAGIGRIRANHTGVIDVSTSPIGDLGAFQIIPFVHALSSEMGIAWRLTQWMILTPLDEEAAVWDGLAPLFYQHLRPDYRGDDLYVPDWKNRLLSRFLVEVDLGDGWQPMPAWRLSQDPQKPLPDWASTALAEVERVRILFPVAGNENG